MTSEKVKLYHLNARAADNMQTICKQHGSLYSLVAWVGPLCGGITYLGAHAVAAWPHLNAAYISCGVVLLASGIVSHVPVFCMEDNIYKRMRLLKAAHANIEALKKMPPRQRRMNRAKASSMLQRSQVWTYSKSMMVMLGIAAALHGCGTLSFPRKPAGPHHSVTVMPDLR